MSVSGKEVWDPQDDVPLTQLIPQRAEDNSVPKILVTPQQKENKPSKWRKALNYKAQEVKTDLFQKQ